MSDWMSSATNLLWSNECLLLLVVTVTWVWPCRMPIRLGLWVWGCEVVCVCVLVLSKLGACVLRLCLNWQSLCFGSLCCVLRLCLNWQSLCFGSLCCVLRLCMCVFVRRLWYVFFSWIFDWSNFFNVCLHIVFIRLGFVELRQKICTRLAWKKKKS